MPSRLAVLKRMETRLFDQPAQSSASIRYLGDDGGKRADQFLDSEFLDVDGSGRRAGPVVQFEELELRDPDRVLITHAYRHQPRDVDQHRFVDALFADEPPQPVDIEVSVARALIVDEEMDGVARHRHYRLRQPFGQERRRVVVVADEIGEQITQRRQDTAVCHSLGLPSLYAGFGAAGDAVCWFNCCCSVSRF